MEGTEKGHVDQPPQYEPPKGADPNYPPPGYQAAPGYPTGGYPPQGGAYPPPQGAHPPGSQPYQGNSGQTTVIVHQPMSGPIPGATFRYMQYPALIVCQHCQATVTTSMDHQVGLLTWAIAGIICLFGLWLGCCLIPFCVDGTKDVVHRCPNCNQIVGKFTHF